MARFRSVSDRAPAAGQPVYGQPTYAQPAYAQAPYGYPTAPSKALSITSMVLGLVGLFVGPLLSIGASTRAALALERAVRAYALVLGRSYALPDDVKAVAVSVLAHRVRPAGMRDGTSAGGDGERVIRELLAALPVPV